MRFTTKPGKHLDYVMKGNHDLRMVGNTLVSDWVFIYHLAKATGLKSNKKRHIKKRYKIVIHQALREGIKRWEKK